jgi:hypothetical protein
MEALAFAWTTGSPCVSTAAGQDGKVQLPRAGGVGQGRPLVRRGPLRDNLHVTGDVSTDRRIGKMLPVSLHMRADP